MSLTIIRGKRRIRRFLVYDLEWVPGSLKLRVCGVFNRKRGYRCYGSIEQFLASELNSENRGCWFYAHAGGLADVQFVLETVIASGKYSVNASFSGSSAIIVRIKQGKNNWTFVDSFWLFRDSLENIGRFVGIEKAEKEKRMTEVEARDFYTNAPISELIRYNQIDCQILYEAIDQMETALLDMGGQLQMTIASCAMHLFRRAYLTKEIDTNNQVNDKARKAYFASRVEVFNKQCWNASYYDINSSFPYAMTKPCPGRVIEQSRYLPDYGLYMADIEIEVPDDYLPPLAARFKGRLFFPTGQWRGWFMSVDIDLLLKAGGRIMKVYECIVFAPFNDLSGYVKTIYEKRKNSTDSFERIVYKYLLNSLYGKFAESAFKSSLAINPKEIRPTMEMLFPGAWIEERKVPVPHMHVPISAYITATARRTLYNYLSLTSDFHYCDTDGFSTGDDYAITKDLGGLKLEKLIREGQFVAPKLYRLDGTELQNDGSWTELGNKGVKSKGFSRPDIERFERLKNGQEIEYIRMTRLKELYRRGKTKPEEKVVTKRLHLDSMPKRFTYPDGHTRAWSIEELTEVYKCKPNE